MDSKIHLILGGARSGKSTRAQELAASLGQEVVFVATYMNDPKDSEMQRRIRAHQAQRPKNWITIENRFNLLDIFSEYKMKVVLLDCLTLWLSYQMGKGISEKDSLKELENALKQAPSKLIIVSNEVGWSLVPETEAGRNFRDWVGRANQLVASHAHTVELMVAGLSLRLK